MILISSALTSTLTLDIIMQTLLLLVAAYLLFLVFAGGLIVRAIISLLIKG